MGILQSDAEEVVAEAEGLPVDAAPIDVDRSRKVGGFVYGRREMKRRCGCQARGGTSLEVNGAGGIDTHGAWRAKSMALRGRGRTSSAMGIRRGGQAGRSSGR